MIRGPTLNQTIFRITERGERGKAAARLALSKNSTPLFMRSNPAPLCFLGAVTVPRQRKLLDEINLLRPVPCPVLSIAPGRATNLQGVPRIRLAGHRPG